MFDCLEIILELIRALRPVIVKIAKHDRDLARQARMSTNGMLLNASEGRQRKGGDQLHLYTTGLGSAYELTDALRAAIAWGYITDDDLVHAAPLLDTARKILWRLAHPKPKPESRRPKPESQDPSPQPQPQP